jgi:hypothetical protein
VEEKSSLGAQLVYLEGLESRESNIYLSFWASTETSFPIGSQETNHQLEESQALTEKLNTRVNELETSLRAAVSTSEELIAKEREASDRVRELVRIASHSHSTADAIHDNRNAYRRIRPGQYPIYKQSSRINGPVCESSRSRFKLTTELMSSKGTSKVCKIARRSSKRSLIRASR